MQNGALHKKNDYTSLVPYVRARHMFVTSRRAYVTCDVARRRGSEILNGASAECVKIEGRGSGEMTEITGGARRAGEEIV